MNWKYLFWKKWFLYDTYWNEKDKYLVDDKWIFKKKSNWKKLDVFNELVYKDLSDFNDNKGIVKGLTQLWEIDEEKWELFILNSKKWDVLYFYNTKEYISEYDENMLLYVDIMFLNKKEILQDKIQKYMNYILLNNITTIKNLANTTTIKNVEEFLSNLWNKEFLLKLEKKDTMLLKKIFFLWKGWFVWYKWFTHFYVFRENNWRLKPIKINKDFNDYEDIDIDPIDKVEIIIKLQHKEKINLFLEKLLDERMFFKEEYITRKDLQAFYDDKIVNYLVD